MKIPFILILLLLIPIATAQIHSLEDSRSIKTGQNSEYYYTQITTFEKTEYLGISKSERGSLAIAKKTGNNLE